MREALKHETSIMLPNLSGLSEPNEADDHDHRRACKDGPECGTETFHQCHLLREAARVLRDRSGYGSSNCKPD